MTADLPSTREDEIDIQREGEFIQDINADFSTDE